MVGEAVVLYALSLRCMFRALRHFSGDNPGKGADGTGRYPPRGLYTCLGTGSCGDGRHASLVQPDSGVWCSGSGTANTFWSRVEVKIVGQVGDCGWAEQNKVAMVFVEDASE